LKEASEGTLVVAAPLELELELEKSLSGGARKRTSRHRHRKQVRWRRDLNLLGAHQEPIGGLGDKWPVWNRWV
jgi:hypothetical protein